MRVPGHQRKSYTWRWTAALAGLAVLAFVLVMAVAVRPAERVGAAASLVTSANAIVSADTFLPGAYVTLSGPVVKENAPGGGEVGTGTIVLSAPPGFEFRTTGAVSVSGTGGIKIAPSLAGCAGGGASSTTAGLTLTTITIEVCSISTSASTVTWAGIGVRPTSAGPFDGAATLCGLPTFPTGDIVLAGTSTITGMPSGTVLGHLVETSGAPHTIQVTTSLPGPFPVNSTQGPLIVCVEDQFGNGAVGAPMSWSISSVPPGATCQALITPQGTTDGTGHASTSLTLGHLDGPYGVTASSGAAGSATGWTTANGGPGGACAAPATSTPVNTSTPVATSTPIPGATATTGPMESVALVAGCNPVASSYADATAIAIIAGAVSPSGILVSIWEFDPATSSWLGYSPQAPQASNLTAVDRLDAIFICVSSAGTWSRPVI